MLFSSPNITVAKIITLVADDQTNLPLTEQFSLGFTAYFNCTQLFC